MRWINRGRPSRGQSSARCSTNAAYLHLLSVFANFNPTTKFISPPLLHRPFRKMNLFNPCLPTIRTIHNRSYGFDPFVDQWPQRDFMPGPNGPRVRMDAD